MESEIAENSKKLVPHYLVNEILPYVIRVLPEATKRKLAQQC